MHPFCAQFEDASLALRAFDADATIRCLRRFRLDDVVADAEEAAAEADADGHAGTDDDDDGSVWRRQTASGADERDVNVGASEKD